MLVLQTLISEHNRRARFYKLTRKGRARLTAETSRWERVVRAVAGVLAAPQSEEV
jgi:YD repeat-containing protein